VTTLQIVRLFHGKPSGNWKGRPCFQAKCPSHKDRMPSLSITQAREGATFLHCFRGCTIEEIMGAKGLTFSDLFETKREMTPAIRQQMRDEELLTYWTNRRKEAVLAFAATRPKVPRELWGDATDPDDFIRKGGDYRKVLRCLGAGWGASDVPGYADFTKRIEHIRCKLYPDEAARARRESETQRIIRDYGFEELWECLPKNLFV